MPELQHFLVVDVGTSWTKAFLFSPDFKLLNKDSCITTPLVKEGIVYLTNKLKAQEAKLLTITDKDKATHLQSLENFLSERAGKSLQVLDCGASLFKKRINLLELLPYIREVIQETELENFIGNKRIKPWTLPQNKKELDMEMNFFLNAVEAEKKDCQGVVLSGGIFKNKLGAYEVLLILNLLKSIFKEGLLTEVFVDSEGISSSWGLLLGGNKIDKELTHINKLATVLRLEGGGKVSFDFGLEQLQETPVGEDEIILLPAGENQTVKINFRDKEKDISDSVTSSGMGIIIDGRLPSSFPNPIKLEKWLASLGGLSVI